MDKRHWPEFGIVNVFCGQEALAYIGIITMFLLKRFVMFGRNYFLQRVIILAVYIFCYFVVFLVTDVSFRPQMEVLTA